MAFLAQRFGLTRYEADEYYKLALAAYDKRKMDEALLAMEQAIELLPRNSEYYAARGFFFLEDGVINKANDDFEKALSIHPYETMAHFGRGMIAYNAKNWDEAQAHFQDAYYSNPERPEILYYLALVHHHKHANEQALAYMQQAHALFEKAGDKRQSDANRWVRELGKLANQQKQLKSEN
jgi:tetratricopeptide (TPR) repeat protein